MNAQKYQQQIRESLEKICMDPSIAKAPRYVQLLKFLVEQAIEGNDLKEQTIGIVLFEQNYQEGNNDGTVRVYMYNLRKKLNKYYSSTGKSDSLVFTLEKGSYNLQFFEKEKYLDRRETNNVLSSFSAKKLLFGASLLVLVIGWFVIFNQSGELYCWEAFLKSDANNICVLADQVVVNDKTHPPSRAFVHPEISSEQDLIVFSKQNDSTKLSLTDYSFYTKAIPHAVQKLTQWFTRQDQEFTMVNESTFRYDDVSHGNVIYVGQYKTMTASKQIFLRGSRVFQSTYNRFIVTKDGETKEYKSKFKDGVLQSEYAMVSFNELKEGNHILYFVSNNDIGVMAMVDNFTQTEFLENFYHKLPSTDLYFNALFKVEGLGRTDLSCELVELEVLDKK